MFSDLSCPKRGGGGGLPGVLFQHLTHPMRMLRLPRPFCAYHDPSLKICSISLQLLNSAFPTKKPFRVGTCYFARFFFIVTCLWLRCKLTSSPVLLPLFHIHDASRLKVACSVTLQVSEHMLKICNALKSVS